MAAPRPCALLLDLDSTLLDSRDGQVPIRRTCEVIANLRPAIDANELFAANTQAFEEYMPEISEPWALGTIDGASVNRETWRRALQTCGADDPELARTAYDTFAQLSREHYHLYDDAHPLLESAGRAGIPLALVTNGASDTQREKLASVGIADLFDAIVISGEVRVTKPDPAIFAIALGLLGVSSTDAWHVGDSLGSDVAGAKAAGLNAVWLNRSGEPAHPGAPRPNAEVAALSDLVELLNL